MRKTVMQCFFLYFVTPFILVLTVSSTIRAENSTAKWKPITNEIKTAILKTKQAEFLTSELRNKLDRLDYAKDSELPNWEFSTETVFKKDLKYIEIQLDKSKRKEVIIELRTSMQCGSGGCGGMILKLDGSAPRFLGSLFLSGIVIHPKTGSFPMYNDHGFRDFAISSDRGGIYVYRYNPKTKRYQQD